MKCTEYVQSVNLTIGVIVIFSTYFSQVGGSNIFLSTTFTRFPTDLKQAFWSFYWGLIVFIWQGMWIIYSLSLQCRVGPLGPNFLTPTLLFPKFLGVYILGLLLYTSRCLLLDRETFELAFVFILGLTVSFYTRLSLTFGALYRARFELAKQERRFDDILIRVRVLNGIAALATYLLSITLHTMSIIAYRSNPPIDPTTTGIITLSIYALILLTLGVIDVVVNDIFTRYTFSSYVTNIIVLSAILDNGPARINAIITSNALWFDIFNIATKISLIFVRNKTTPLFPRKDDWRYN